MLGIFSKVSPYIKPKSRLKVPRPDNLVFKLHYKVTFALLIASVIFVSSYDYIDRSGSAIQCMFDKGSGIPPKVINRYCWVMSTFTLPEYFEGTVGEKMIHYGVGAEQFESEKVYHAYYQWVPLMLFWQALTFYAPHWIWKQLDNGRLKHVVVGLNEDISDDGTRKDKVNQIVKYMHDRRVMKGEHKWWAIKFFLCECLNLVNVLIQIKLTDVFLGGEFSKYGTEVINFPYQDPEDRVDPMSRIFPRMTKCTFHKYGGSGTIQKFDALCVLGMNIVNEKIYIFLWFWYIILAVVTAIYLVYKMVQYCRPNARERSIKLESSGYLDRSVKSSDVKEVVKNLSYPDWLIIFNLSQSMEKKNFGSLLEKLAESYRKDDVTQQGPEADWNDDMDGGKGDNSDEESGVYPNLNRAATFRSHDPLPTNQPPGYEEEMKPPADYEKSKLIVS